ncbi:hypothetical protein ES708_33638 [subsurface metagenome]
MEFSQYALDRAKDQTGRIRYISGSVPILRVATESFFSPYLNICVADPKEINDEATDLKINETQFLSSYYSTFRSLMQLSPRVDLVHNQRYFFAYDESAGISLGMNQHLLSRLEYGEIRRSDLSDIPWSMEVSRMDKRSTKYYPDGIAVSLDDRRWSPDLMSLDPSKRGP